MSSATVWDDTFPRQTLFLFCVYFSVRLEEQWLKHQCMFANSGMTIDEETVKLFTASTLYKPLATHTSVFYHKKRKIFTFKYEQQAVGSSHHRSRAEHCGCKRKKKNTKLTKSEDYPHRWKPNKNTGTTENRAAAQRSSATWLQTRSFRIWPHRETEYKM